MSIVRHKTMAIAEVNKIKYIIREGDRSFTDCPFGVTLGQIKGDSESIDKFLHSKRNKGAIVSVGSWVCVMCPLHVSINEKEKYVLCSNNPQLTLFRL